MATFGTNWEKNNTSTPLVILAFLVVVIVTFSTSIDLKAQTTYYSIASGNWNNGSIWSTTQGGASCNCFPQTGNVVISSGHIVKNTVNNFVLNGSITVQSNATLDLQGTMALGSTSGCGYTLTLESNSSITASGNGNDEKLRICGVTILSENNGAGYYRIPTGGPTSFNQTGCITPTQPGTFTTSTTQVCKGQSYTYSVPSSSSVSSYSFSYSGTGATISSGTSNSRTIAFSSTATSGTLSVTATNTCGTSSARTLAITVKQTVEWTGSVSSAWDNNSNWCGGKPTSTVDAIIPAGVPNTPIITTSATCRNITISSGSKVEIASGSLVVAGTTSLDGELSLTAASSSVTFNGDFTYNGTWNANASAKVTFNAKATFSKAFTSPSSLNVNGQLTFPASGNITMGSGAILKMGQNATYTNASAASYVEGRVQKKLASTTQFIFPIGKGGIYRRVAVQPYDADTTTFQAEYFIGKANNTAPNFNSSGIYSVSSVEYWDLSRAYSDTSGVKITLFWGSESNVIDPLSVLVAHYSYNAVTGVGVWENKGQAGLSGTASSGNVTSLSYQKNFSPYTLGSSSPAQTLPVDFEYFTLSRVSEGIELLWGTYSEENNLGFAIERSIDGFKTLESVGFVKSQGSSSDKQAYSFLDHYKNASGIYYRLKQIDLDGKFKFSEIRFIEANSNRMISKLYPNPTTGNVILALPDSEFSNYISYSIVASNGIVKVEGQKTDGSEISAALSKSISVLNNGVYTLILKNGSNQYSLKLIKI